MCHITTAALVAITRSFLRMQSGSTQDSNSLSGSLEQLATASERLISLLNGCVPADAVSGSPSYNAKVEQRHGVLPSELEHVKAALFRIFDPRAIKDYDGSEAMERVRAAYLNAALEMYVTMVDKWQGQGDSFDDPSVECNLVSHIGHSLLKELIDVYQLMLHGNDKTTFTTEQRTALESAFLIKPKLNTVEKRALAKACNLNPRQVEVWFSNRRTRKNREERRMVDLRHRAGRTAGETSSEDRKSRRKTA